MAETECALCDYAIRPGDRREIREGETVHTHCAIKEAARESYRFYIGNPADNPGVSFGFWYRESPEREYPMLENTGGLTVYVSRQTDHGEAIPVKPEFIEAFGLGWHWLMCYRPPPSRLADTIEEAIEDYYDGVPGIHEKWALGNLLAHALLSDDPLPVEWGPLIDFADSCTAMGVPEVDDG